MFESRLSLNYQEFDQAFAEFAAHSRKSSKQVLRGQAKLFVRDIMKVTPPNKDWSWRPKVGAAMVKDDMRRAVIASRSKKQTYPAAATIHKRMRNRKGRVPKSMRPERATGVGAHLKRMLARVGLLASGWNAAAAKYGFKPPQWIARHGSRRGNAVEIDRKLGLRIRIENAVRFASEVTGMQRRTQWALNNRARQMEKQLEDRAIKQAARKAKFATAS
jgi:hypothetical protein